jgi:hypothetical protein
VRNFVVIVVVHVVRSCVILTLIVLIAPILSGMEVSTKSSEEQTTSTLIAGAGIAAAAVAAGLILTNLPDPSQF